MKWLAGLGLEQYAESFAENDIDMDVLAELTDEDLKGIGISLGHRKKILRAIQQLAAPADPVAMEGPVDDPAANRVEVDQGERRHLTVLFADMVGSTKTSSELDPEDYRSVIRAYQEACAAAITRYDGFVAQYMGDGILAFFGYPRAHEDDAERAIRAGKEAIEAVAKLAPRPGLGLQSRVGIATGEVVVGDMIGEGAAREAAVAGATPNLAARLQALALPDTVVISGSTCQLVEGRFKFRDLGPQTLKGIPQPVDAFVVGDETEAHARFEAEPQHGRSQLVGRQEEVGLFMRRWELVKEGDGQVILLSAEAGVGKSRVLRAVQDRLKGESFNRILYFGSPFHQNSALYPTADQLRRVLRVGKQQKDEAVLDRLEQVLQELAVPVEKYIPYLAALLGIDVSERFGTSNLSPQDFRARTLESAIAVIERMSEGNPVLMVVEDAHWIDPTTLELLSTLVNRLREKRILLVIAFRPEFQAPWGTEGHVTTCTLNHLSRKESAALVRVAAGGKPLPDGVVDRIVARTDGVPLFTEELTKAVLESGALRDAGDSYELQGALSSLAIPDSLHDSLMARLDRLPTSKEIAQIGSVIGREFSYELLSQVAGLDGARFDEALDELVGSGLLFCHGKRPEAIFEFKHALIRDVSYESLLKSNRRRIHERIAIAMESGLPGQGASAPELIAHHFEGAGNVERAIAYWYKAGQRGSEHSAYHEAIAHCERGLKLLESVSDSEQRTQWELDFQLVIGVSSMAIHGFSSPTVLAAYSRARNLAKEQQDRTRLFAATWGVWMYQQQTGQIASARNMADELIQLSEQLGDTEFRLEAHHAAWATCYRMGDFANCLYHAEQGIALHDPDKHPQLAHRYSGHDAGICAGNHASLSSWFLGHPDQAINLYRASAELAERIKHPFSMVHANWFGSMLYRHLQDPERAYIYTDNALKQSRELKYPQLTGYSEIIHGWAIAQLRDKDEGIRIMNSALDDLTRIGAWARCGTFLPCLVEVHAINNETEKALATVERTLDLIQKSGERTAETEILVLKGEILSRAGHSRTDVEDALHAALDLARRDGVRAMELRAATALARLWLDMGRRQEALELLAPVYATFTEGLGTPDLKAARVVLDELSAAP